MSVNCNSHHYPVTNEFRLKGNITGLASTNFKPLQLGLALNIVQSLLFFVLGQCFQLSRTYPCAIAPAWSSKIAMAVAIRLNPSFS